MRYVRELLAVTAAGAAFAFAAPAQAAIVVGSGDAGTEYVIDFTGQVDGNVETGVSALLTLVFTGTSNGGKTYNFGYDLVNDSSLLSRLSSFGFDTDPVLSGASATGLFDIVGYNHNYPGLGQLDVCFRDSGGQCNGGGSGGLLSNESASGTLSLTFGSALDSLELDNVTVRYQAIAGSQYGKSGIGIGTPVPAVPEPATWALMLLGFGAVGFGMRRRTSAEPRMRVLYN